MAAQPRMPRAGKASLSQVVGLLDCERQAAAAGFFFSLVLVASLSLSLSLFIFFCRTQSRSAWP